jgi:hypothetical protein
MTKVEVIYSSYRYFLFLNKRQAERCQLKQGCGPGSGFNDFVDPAPDAGVRRKKKTKGIMHFLYILFLFFKLKIKE